MAAAATAKPISIQLYTVRELAKNDFPGMVRKIADVGYAGVELAGLHGMKPAEFRKFADDLGIKVSSSHVGMPTKENLSETVDTAKALGYTVCVTGFGPDDFKTKDLINAAADKYQAGADLLKASGLKLAIHNHWWEFDKVDGQLGYDLFLQRAPGMLGELDIYWACNFGSQEVPAIIKKHAKRLPLLHVKDGPLVKGQPHTAVGSGKMDIPACIAAIDPAVTQWLVVELDEYTHGHDRMMEAVKDSYTYMTSKGLAKGRK